MTLAEVPGPFRPGAGRLPPHLAGREAEQALFRARLAQLDRGEAPPSEIILYGPRGNGKTAFLVWIEEVAKPAYSVDVIRLTPSKVRAGHQLAERLLPNIWWDEGVPDTPAVRELTWRPGNDSRVPAADQVFAARASKRPLVLLLDEAHQLDLQVGEEFLNAAQRVGRKAPFLLVLAGTPDLRTHLGTMGVSFWNRGRKLRIDRLDESAAADAIRRPLEAEGIPISEDALTHIVRESEGYPYFVQLWGAALWNRANADPSAPSQRLTTADTTACQSIFESEKNDYYLDRHKELRKIRMVRPAQAVAAAFEVQERLNDFELEAAIRRGLGPEAGDDEVEAVAEQFDHLGFVWNADGSPDWEPGIPSLMDYIREVVPSA